MELFIYQHAENKQDNTPHESDTLTALILGKSNAECEAIASSRYGDHDYFYWSYTKH